MNQSKHKLSNAPIYISIVAMLINAPALLWEFGKEIVEGMGQDFLQSNMKVDTGLFDLLDADLYIAVVALFVAFICGILYKKEPKKMGAAVIVSSLIGFYFFDNIAFLGIISLLFSLFAGYLAIKENSKIPAIS